MISIKFIRDWERIVRKIIIDQIEPFDMTFCYEKVLLSLLLYRDDFSSPTEEKRKILNISQRYHELCKES